MTAEGQLGARIRQKFARRDFGAGTGPVEYRENSAPLCFAAVNIPYAEYFPFVERKLQHTILVFMRPSPRLNILLAEDEQSVALSISFALKSDGHKIEIVPDGEQALLKISDNPGAFDLLITDNNMPRMAGIELVRRLCDTAFSGKIVVLSAHLSPDIRAAYNALGVAEMMAKPFDVHQFRSVIKQIARDIQPTSFNQNGHRPDESVPHRL